MRSLMAALLVLSAPLASAHATAYTFTTLNPPNAENVTYVTAANGINNAGQVVGTYISLGYQNFVYDSVSGSYTRIAPPPAYQLLLTYGINDAGAIVGTVATYTGSPNNYAFLRDASGTFTYFAPAFLTSSIADGVNAAGQVIGYYGNGSNSQPHTTSYLRNIDGTFTYISDPNAKVSFYDGDTVVTGINNAGLVVGSYSSRFYPNVNGSFLFDPSTGTYTNFNDPASPFTNARGINNVGQVVGTIFDTSLKANTGFVLDLATGIYTSVVDPDGVATTVNAINDHGQIVGSYTDAAGILHPFLATPITSAAVPEPSSLILLGGGAAGLCMLRRRRTSAG